VTTPLLLIVDDDASIRGAVATLLRSRGYAVVTAATGADALAIYDQEQPALAVIDLGLPDMDAAAVCARIRARGDLPIVVLSVRSEERAKVEALDAGADDYVTKPFGPEELLARIRAALRRSQVQEPERRGHLHAGGLTIDFDRRRVHRDGEEIRLTPKEFDLLTLLAAQSGRVLTHKRIARAIWGSAASGQPEHLRVLVGQLRKKLEPDPAHPRYVVTEPWVGYRFDDQAP
jgi:two-component system KDP operon response regulator KdpE